MDNRSAHVYEGIQVSGGRAQFGNTYRVGLDDPLRQLPSAQDAPFNAYQRRHDPTCLPNTRVDLLRKIFSWAHEENSPSIFWLSGLAGTGKSTIARTVAAEYSHRSSIAASFFFSRDGGEGGHLRHAGRFVTSLAVQLANNIPPLKQTICDAISTHSDIAHRALSEQWRHLILGPLLTLGGGNSASRYILVVDALDECEDENDIRTILQLLAEVRSLVTVQLRVFLTSRPDAPIRNGFSRRPIAEHEDFVLHNILPQIIDRDITAFLEYNLRFIGQENHLGDGWPGSEIISALVQSASGLFIWASTACRFIREGRQFAVKRLNTMTYSSSSNATAPEKHLNEIYITILQHSVRPDYSDEEKEEQYRMLRITLGGIVVLFSPLSVKSLSMLLQISEIEVNQTLNDLYAILHIPKDPKDPLRLHHPSFHDFLLDQQRCRDPNFCVDETQAHQQLADRCIQLMATFLKQDICAVDAPGLHVAELGSTQVNQCLPPEVQYACLYWIQHLNKSGIRLSDNDQVHEFLNHHFLHWLEALGWMQKVSEGIYAIISLESIAQTSHCPDLYAFIHDMRRFALYNRTAIELAPLQVYFSGLVFAPSMSIIKKRFKEDALRWIKRLPIVDDYWSAMLQTLEGHQSSINAVAFSPDGKVLASGSVDHTVKLWDAITGAVLQTLNSHKDWITAIAFSPDSKVLASSSDDDTVKLWDTSIGTLLQTLESPRGYHDVTALVLNGKILASGTSDYDSKNSTVKLWDVGTGTVLQILEGPRGKITAIAFSPNINVLAVGYVDNTAKLWDISVGAMLQTLEGHQSSVDAVAFSLDGKVLASGSDDHTVKLWDAITGAVLQTLNGHKNRITTIAFSPDGKVLASGSFDLTIKLWDTSTGTMLQTLKGRGGAIGTIAFSPDGRILASGSNRPESGDMTVKMWDTSIRAGIQTLNGHEDCISTIAFSPDGKVLASGSEDRTAKLWDAITGAVLQTLNGHKDPITSIAFSPDSMVLASGSSDRTIKLWDTVTGVVLQTLNGHKGEITSIVFSLDGKVLASGSSDYTVKLWNVSTGALLQTFDIDHYSFTLSFSNDGTHLQTNRGLLPISILPSTDLAVPYQQPYPTIFTEDQWVYSRSGPILFLPPEYRTHVTAIYTSTIGITNELGRVIIIELVL